MTARSSGSIAAVIVVLFVAGTAFVLGRSTGADEADLISARRQAAAVGYAGALHAGWEAGYIRSLSTGTIEGLAAGRAFGTRTGAASARKEIERRAGVSAQVGAEAAASVAATERTEAEALYYETHPWVDP
jgi:hypothetical protein